MLSKFSGLMYVALCFIIVGSSYPIAREAMDSIPTWTFTCITFLIGFLFLLPFTLYKDKTNWFRISLRDWGITCVLSLLGAVLYMVLLFYGLSSTTALTASIITSTAPAVVLVISVCFLREKLKINAALSVTLAVVSVVIMTLPNGQSGGHNTLLGLMFLSLSTLANALNIIIANRVRPTIRPLTISAGVCLTGAIFSLPMALSELQHYHLSDITSSQWEIIIYYGVVVWALSYIVFFMGVHKISAATAGMCVALIPVASMLCSVMFYHDHVRARDLIATLIIVLSVVLSEVRFKGHQKGVSEHPAVK